MSKKLGIKGHSTRGNEIIEILEMLGGKNCFHLHGLFSEHAYYFIGGPRNDEIRAGEYMFDEYAVLQMIDDMYFFTLEEFLKKYPFKVGDKVFLYDNITEGCVTEMKWDEDKGTVKYCVYTSAEYWCDVKELLKWNAEFLVNKEKGEEVGKMLVDITLSHLHRNHLEDVLSELYEHIKTTPKEELEREFEEIKEWSNVGPTVEEFMAFCECVNKKPKYPDNYDECCEVIGINRHDVEIDLPQPYQQKMFNFFKLRICCDAYWKIAGEQMGLDKPWKPDWNEETDKFTISNKCNKIYLNNTAWYAEVLSFPTAEMRDAFYDNFKDLIKSCMEML